MTTNDWPMVDVLRVKALEGHRLWVRFSDGNEGIRDLSDLIAGGGPMVEPLQAPDYFARAFVEMGAPTWPNGFDLDPVNLYMQLRDAGALTRAAAEYFAVFALSLACPRFAPTVCRRRHNSRRLPEGRAQ